MRNQDVAFLKEKATEIRKLILKAAHESGRKTHPGPALSAADITTAIYFGFMDLDPADPNKPDRDRFILSKGHGCLVQYACLAALGFFPEEELATVRHINSRIQGHPSLGKTPGVDMTTGSLGNGLGAALGMAYYLKLQGLSSKVFTVVGDGELNEGTLWEAIQLAPALRQDNLIVVIDQNHFQSTGSTEDILPMPYLADVFKNFGWKVFEINGHDMAEIVSRLQIATTTSGQPTCLVANTVKGKGVSFMENSNKWHQNNLGAEGYERAIRELAEVRS